MRSHSRCYVSLLTIGEHQEFNYSSRILNHQTFTTAVLPDLGIYILSVMKQIEIN